MRFLLLPRPVSLIVFYALAIAIGTRVLALPADSENAAEFNLDSFFNEISERVQVEQLSNGMKVVFYKRPQTSPVFAGAVVVRVGSTDEPDGLTGVSHMFEHMAFKGTTEIGTKDYSREKPLLDQLEILASKMAAAGGLSKEDMQRWHEIHEELRHIWVADEFTREYEKRGANGMNATTDPEFTKYFVNLPRASFEFWCQMESERLIQPVMRQFYQERDVILEERRMRYEDDPFRKLYFSLLAAAFTDHPYRRPVIGYEADIRRLLASRTIEFRKDYYVPANIAIGLVGEVDAAGDLQLLEQYFGRMPAGPLPQRVILPEPKQQGQREVVLEMKTNPQLLVGYHKPNYPDPDDPKISVMLEAFAGSITSPLYHELVRKRRVASSVGQEEGPGSAYPGLASFSLVPRENTSNHELLESFDEVLGQFKAKPIDPERMLVAKRALVVDFVTAHQSNANIALAFATYELLYGGWDVGFKWLNEALQVTAEDAGSMLDKYFLPSNRTVARLEAAGG